MQRSLFCYMYVIKLQKTELFCLSLLCILILIEIDYKAQHYFCFNQFKNCFLLKSACYFQIRSPFCSVSSCFLSLIHPRRKSKQFLNRLKQPTFFILLASVIFFLFKYSYEFLCLCFSSKD